MSETTVIKILRPTVAQSHGEARREAARLWNRRVRLHRWFRKRHLPWPSESRFKAHFRGRFALHAQTVQALVEQFVANIDATHRSRKNGRKAMRYPWKTKKYFAVPWKGQAVHYLDYKLGRSGATRVRIGEAYATQTCPACGHRHKPAGRLYRCTRTTCSFEAARDVVGAVNIRNRYLNGGTIVAGTLMPSGITQYLRPVKLRSGIVPMTRGTLAHYHPSTDSTPSGAGACAPRRLEGVA